MDWHCKYRREGIGKWKLLENKIGTFWKNILKFSNIHVKGKLNGNRFFGLYTSDYRDAIEKLDQDW